MATSRWPMGRARGLAQSRTARDRTTGRRVAIVLVVCGLGAGVMFSLAATGPIVAGASRPQVVRVSTARVPHVGTVLTTGSGRTLYYFTANPPGKSLCTGACAQIWPPFMASKHAHIHGPHGVKGLSLISVGSGRWQVAFHNNALYRFKSDTKKGQAGGQGVLGKWFAAMKSGIVPVPSAAAAPSATTTTGPPTTTSQAPQTPVTTPQTQQMPQTPTSTPPAQQTPAPMPMVPQTPAAPPPTSPPPSPPPTAPRPTTPPTSTPPTMAPSGGGVSF